MNALASPGHEMRIQEEFIVNCVRLAFALFAHKFAWEALRGFIRGKDTNPESLFALTSVCAIAVVLLIRVILTRRPGSLWLKACAVILGIFPSVGFYVGVIRLYRYQ